jgi:hypothetical protein
VKNIHNSGWQRLVISDPTGAATMCFSKRKKQMWDSGLGAVGNSQWLDFRLRYMISAYLDAKFAVVRLRACHYDQPFIHEEKQHGPRGIQLAGSFSAGVPTQ